MQIKFKNAIRRINIMAMLVVSRDARMFNVCKSRDVMQTQGLKLHHFSQCRKTFQQTLASGYSLPKARTSVCICMPGLPLLFTMFSQPPEAFSWFSSVHFAWLFYCFVQDSLISTQVSSLFSPLSLNPSLGLNH